MANFLRHIMNAESTGDTRARNPNSSAKGLFQFIDSTWQACGGGDVWDVATQCRNVVTLAQRNGRALQSVLGREPTAGEYYLAHFAGEEGASDILRASPNTPITSLLSAGAIRANSSIEFRGIRFRNLTAGQLRAWAAGKMDEEISLTPGGSLRDEEEARRQFMRDNREAVQQTTGALLSDEQINSMDVMGQLFTAIFMAVMSKALEQPTTREVDQTREAPQTFASNNVPPPAPTPPAPRQIAASRSSAPIPA